MPLLTAICLTPAVISFGGQIPVERGLAAKYAGDKGIEKDSNVILFTDFESDQWHKYWSGGKRKTVRVTSEDKERSFEPLQNKALQIEVRKGDHYGASIEYNFKEKTGGERPSARHPLPLLNAGGGLPLEPDIRTQPLEAGVADALHVLQLLEGLEASALLAQLDQRIGPRGADARQQLEFLRRGGVHIDRACKTRLGIGGLSRQRDSTGRRQGERARPRDADSFYHFLRFPRDRVGGEGARASDRGRPRSGPRSADPPWPALR